MGKEIHEWSATASENNFVPADGGWPEGMLRSDVNNAARENLSDLRSWHDNMDWQRIGTVGPLAADVGTFTRTGDYSFTITFSDGTTDIDSQFPPGRMLKFYNAGAAVGLVTQVVTSVYSGGGTTTVTTTASVPKAINAGATEVRAYFSHDARLLALTDASDTFYIPETNDSAGIQGAIDEASAANGGTVLLPNFQYDIDVPINILNSSGHGQIIIRGALPETVLRMENGVNIDKLFDIDQASELVTFENVRFNCNRSNNPTGNSYCLSVAGNLGLTFVDCQFIDCERAVDFTTVSGTRIFFSRCKFFQIQEYGIVTDFGVSSTHRGIVSECIFDGSQMNVADSAAIKVSGEWAIRGNRFDNMGDGTITKRSVWLWNKTSTFAGGTESSVSDNLFDLTNAANGYAIEIGGDYVPITGNKILLGTNGKGVYLNGTGGGTDIEDTVVNANVIKNGQACIHVTDRCLDSIIQGNMLSPSTAGTGIILDGESAITSGNNIRGGTTGISVGANAVGNMIEQNFIKSSSADGVIVESSSSLTTVRHNRILGTLTDGIHIESGATGVYAFDNHIRGTITNLVNNLSTDAKCLGNQEYYSTPHTPDRIKNYGTFSETSSSGSELYVTGFQGQAFPPGAGLAYGVWRFWWQATITGATGDDVDIRVRIGPNGDNTDPVAFTFNLNESGVASNEPRRFSASDSTPVGDLYTADNIYTCTDNAELITVTHEEGTPSGSAYTFDIDYFFVEFLRHE